MGNILKILKINALSLLALPLLLLATMCKLIAKAMDKLALMFGMSSLTLLIYFIFEAIKQPEGFLQWFLLVLVFAVVGFLLVAIIYALIRFGMVVWNAITGFFNNAYEVTYMSYLKFYETCTTDFEALNGEAPKKGYLAACLFYTIVLGLNKVIITFITISLYLAIGGSVVFVVATLLSLNSNISKTLGINLFTYIANCDTFTKIYGIVFLLAYMATVVIVLLSLGLEWHEWAMELKMTGEQYKEHVQQLQDKKLEAENTVSDKDKKYMDKLSKHLNEVEKLEPEVERILAAGDNPVLRSAWSDYLKALTNITHTFNSRKEGIPITKFKKLIPKIDALDKQCENIKRLLARRKEEAQNLTKNSAFFSGCNTAEKLEKRYKSLCKAYHPDAEGGDEETFKALQEEYEKIKASL